MISPKQKIPYASIAYASVRAEVWTYRLTHGNTQSCPRSALRDLLPVAGSCGVVEDLRVGGGPCVEVERRGETLGLVHLLPERAEDFSVVLYRATVA